MEKIWLKNYPKGVPAEIDLNEFNSLVEYFKYCCLAFSEKPAFVNMGGALSYGDLWEYSDHLAAHLQADFGIQKGDRVGIMMPNLLQYPIALLAILKIGAVVVNINPLYTSRELAHLIKDSAISSVFVLNYQGIAKTLEQVLQSEVTVVKQVVVTEISDLLPFPKNKIIHLVLKYFKKAVPKLVFKNSYLFNDLLKKSPGVVFTAPVIELKDLAFLQYTGGTTGVSKGAMLTHGNMVANVQQTSAWVKPCVVLGEEVVVTALPLYHIFALMANCLLFMKFGAKNVLITNPRELNGLVKELRKHAFSVIIGVNTLFSALANHPGFAKLNFKHLRFSLGGGMAVQKTVAEKWHQLTGCVVLQGYGLTEASPVVSIGSLDSQTFSDSIGLPVPSTEIAIVDDQGHELPLGETGELAVRGPQVMLGYWGESMRAETEKVLRSDGWLLTGDCGVIAPDGRIFLKERKKDMILISGFNVYPSEVEEVISACPGVLEVAVVGVYDAQHLEFVKAFVVRRDPALSAEQIIAFCHQNLTGYKVPKVVEFRESLPKSNVGKILRRELR